MAEVVARSKYKVIHPIRHDGKAYGRGAVVELSVKDGERLHRLRHVESFTGTVVIAGAAPAQLSSSTLGKMNIAELTEYAESHNVKLDAGATKDVILAAITAATPEA